MLVIAKRQGRLANQLWLFAHFLALARERGLRLANPSFADYAACFTGTRDDLLCRYPPGATPLAGSRRARRLAAWAGHALARGLDRLHLDTPVLRSVRLPRRQALSLESPDLARLLGPRRVLMFQGWLYRCPSYLPRHADAIRSHFTLVPEHMRRVEAVVGAARAQGDLLVGVHVRHGDYATWSGGRFYFETAVYVRVMRAVRALFPDRQVGFLVCSDAAQAAAAFGDLRVCRGTGEAVEDLYALARCDYLVGPPSTFSMWASFHGSVPLYMLEHADRTPVLRDFAVCADCENLRTSFHEQVPPVFLFGLPP